jgi:voltage-gated potassium channel Kch
MYDHLVERARGALSSLTLRRAVLLIVATATVLALTAALLVWMIDPAIDTFGDALWWAVSTVTTVGVSQRTREAQEDERRQLDQLFERLDQLERRLLDERR